MNATACKRLFSLGCVAHTDGAVFQEAAVRQLSHPGGASLAWGESSLEEVGFGIQKLTIRCQFDRAAVSVEEDVVGKLPTPLNSTANGVNGGCLGVQGRLKS